MEPIKQIVENSDTTLGRAFALTIVILIVGLGFVSVPAGLVASALSKAREMEDDEERRDAIARLDD